ncbi:adenylyl-sulfate kinase [filamentous cyanobacterium CCP5]|nr:adenylyl-sulfate kinase [filamentous cyanobacterium CCP5]
MVDPSLLPLIQSMQRPEFYPHPVAETIRLVQTHVSWVLLTGDYAYKVKKPVNFGFLDYSSLEKRHHFCQEELRLNRRTAPDLYLEVVAIAQQGDDYTLGEPAVEYAVKMRQFPQGCLLSQLFERGELTEALMRRLAQVVADFHQQAETSDYIRSFGETSQIRQSIDENYDQTVDFIGGPQTQEQFDGTQAFSDRFFIEQQDLLQQRRYQGWIRACHGDLHLNNICLWDDRLVLFDCIEFNEPFRYVDVMFDIAYIVMDMWVEGRQDLSAAFLSEYVERTGDWQGLAVLPLYVSRQSYVRAKVTSFLLGDPSVDEATKQQASQKAAKYYRLAYDYVKSRAGRLVIMAGLSGSGKSTVAREVTRQLGAIQIRSDAVRKHLAGVPLEERGDDSLYTPEMSQKTYDRLLELGLELTQMGYTVVLDAKYDRQIQRQAVLDRAGKQGVPVDILHCQAPLPVLKQRLQKRQGDIADATVAVLERQVMEEFTGAERSRLTAIDTTQPLTSQVAAIVGDKD